MKNVHVGFWRAVESFAKRKGIYAKSNCGKMNVSQNTVVRWENNYKFPTQNNLIQLSRIFHVSLDYLVGIERKRTIVVEQLTQEQITVLNTLVLEFQFRQKGTGLTQRQMNILNAVIVAFTK